MASAVRMSRNRGSVSGLALVLLGAWGGLAPFIGPYFNFGFQPDKAWSYSSGRLYAAIVPGGVALLMGLVLLGTRSRWFGVTCSLIAALAGAWFVAGRAVLELVGPNPGTYLVGAPIATSLQRVVLTNLATFEGVGVLIVFFATLSCGRISIAAYKDFLKFGDGSTGPVGGTDLGGLASVGLAPSSPSYDPYQPTAGIQTVSPTLEQPVVGGQARFPSQYPSAGQETVRPDSAGQHGAATNTYAPGQVTYSPGQTQYPPTEAQTNPLTAPTQEQKSPRAQ